MDEGRIVAGHRTSDEHRGRDRGSAYFHGICGEVSTKPLRRSRHPAVIDGDLTRGNTAATRRPPPTPHGCHNCAILKALRRLRIEGNAARPLAGGSPGDTSAATDAGEVGAQYVGPARSFGELLSAFRLVHDAYVEQGYATVNAARIRLGPYNLLPPPTTATFVLTRRREHEPAIASRGGQKQRSEPTNRNHRQLAAIGDFVRGHAEASELVNEIIADNDAVIGTVSIVVDTPRGLPAGHVFPDELDRLRSRGRRAAEAIMLAHRPGEPDRAGRTEFRRLLMLLRYVIDHARLCNADDLLILTNPHHEAFYRRKLAFDVVAGPRPCANVRGAPAVLLRHDMHSVKARADALVPEASRFFLNGQPDPKVLAGYRLRKEDVLTLLFLAPHLWQADEHRAACQRLLHTYQDVSAAFSSQENVKLLAPQADLDRAAPGLPREAVA